VVARKGPAVLAVLAVLSALTACSGSLSGASTASPKTQPTPRPTSLEALGAAYTKIAKTANAVSCKATAVFSNASSTVAQLKQAAATLAKAIRVAADGMRKLPWPPDIEPDAKALIKVEAATEAAYLAVSQETTRDAVITALNEAYEVSKAAPAAANLLRGDLGISSVSHRC
jgi:hypothetical protein